MPTLPQYDSQRNINAGLSEPMRDEASFPFELQQKVTGVLSEMNAKWMEQQDVMQYTEAKAKYEVSVADIQSRAASDPDFKNAGKYTNELQQAKVASLGGIKNKAVANKAALEFDYGSQIAGIKIDAGFRQKQLVYNRNMFDTNVSALVKKGLTSTTDAEKSKSEIELLELVSASVSSGVMTQEEADESIKEARLSTAQFDAQYNPDGFIKNIESYKLDTENRVKLRATANEMKKKIKAEELQVKREVQTSNSIEYTKSLISLDSKPMSAAEIFKAMSDDTIPANFGQAYVKALTTKITSDDIVEDKSGFTEYIQEVFDSENPDAVITAITNVLNGGSDGRVNQEELNILLQAAVSRNEEINKKESAFSRFGKAIAKRKDAVIDFIKGVSEGKEPEIAKQEAIEKDNIKANPNRTKFAVGQIVNHSGMSFEVLRFDENGNPVFKKL